MDKLTWWQGKLMVATIIMTVLNVADISTTHEGLKTHGLEESNTHAQKFMDAFGIIPGLLILKTLSIGIMLSFSAWRKVTWPLWVSNGVMALTVANNHALLSTT